MVHTWNPSIGALKQGNIKLEASLDNRRRLSKHMKQKRANEEKGMSFASSSCLSLVSQGITLLLSLWLYSYRYFQDRCKNTVSTQCDFSVLSKYGDHTVRVRAEFADEYSEWVNITFCPLDDSKPFIPFCSLWSSCLAFVHIGDPSDLSMPTDERPMSKKLGI